MTDWLTIGIRAALYVNLMLMFGLPLFGLYSLNGAERQSVLPFRALTAGLAILGLALSALGIAAMTARMAGVAQSDIDRETLDMVITQTSVGAAWQVRIGALLVTLVCALSAWRHHGAALFIAITAAGIALASLAWSGHDAPIQTVHLGGAISGLLC